MTSLSLNGTEWKVCKKKSEELIPATVPGTIHEDLLNAKKIEDPFYRDNEVNLMWIGETDWVYTREFDITEKLLQNENILLKCHGIDTVATIYINGKKAGYTDNMFRIWNLDIKKYLKSGTNTIKIVLGSAIPGKCHIRKMQCNSGWDWGPQLVTCGIWKDIEICFWSTAKIKDALVQQKHFKKKNVTAIERSKLVDSCGNPPAHSLPSATFETIVDLNVTLEIEGRKSGLLAEVTLYLNEQEISSKTFPIKKSKEIFEFQ